MSSIVPRFEYDIFISYRHNDNRSGWVTEFVKALQEELASTIKEPISVYFDVNPHDGLLETHNVDKSLEGKLKCLIFIPIISQTYCDTKSFAWQHEFVAFNKLTQEDQLGRDIKLSNGNVASRILPIKIHDLDTEDKSLIENEIGGALRAIEFIYKEAGVNRPLKSTDSKADNHNKTDYRNQVNKVANSIKEIIGALKIPTTQITQATNTHQPIKEKPKNKKPLIAIITSILVLAVAGYFVYPRIVSSTREETTLDRSIAVLPFVNMSNDPEQDYFSDGLSEELLNLLGKIPELKVIARTSSFAFKGKSEDIHEIGKKLGVTQILEGSVRKSGNTMRITAQLIKVEDGSHLWSETYNREMDDIFKIQDEIAAAVVRELKIKLYVSTDDKPNVNREAYNLMLQADFYSYKEDSFNLVKAVNLYKQALTIDSLNTNIWSGLAWAYVKQRSDKGRLAAQRAIDLDATNGRAYWVMGILKRNFDWDWKGAETYFDKALIHNCNNAKVAKAWMAEYLGRHDDALKFAREAIIDDPINAAGSGVLVTLLSNGNQFDEAMLQASKMLQLSNPNLENSSYYRYRNVYGLMVRIHLQQSKPELAIPIVQKITDPQLRSYYLIMIHNSLKRNRQRDQELEGFVKKYKDVSPFNISEVYAVLGETEKAFEWLNTAYKQHDQELRWVNTSPWLENIKDDKRYDALLVKLKMPKL